MLRIGVTSALAGLMVLMSVQAMADTIEIRVSDGNDDSEEHLTEGNSIDITSSDLELGAEGGGSDTQEIGIRFQGLDIAPLSTINSAHVQFTVDETDNEPTSVIISGELSPNAAMFSTTTGDITARTKTSASVAWNDIPNWSVEGEAGPDQRTPDLSAVIQEIIDQPGWAAGNALALIISPTGPNSERTAESYNGDAAAAALLQIDFTPIPEPSSVVLTAIGLLSILGFGGRRRRAA